MTALATKPRAAQTRGASVSLHNITRSFGDTPVLKGIDLDVRPGEFIAIVGQSGSGKSTLLRIIAGLDQGFEGSFTVGDTASEKASSRIMYQEPRLLPWASVIENVAFGLGPVSGRDRAFSRARTALEAVGLGDRGAEWPDVLSGGQKQRVALARALVSRPDVLVLDEPLGALDALTRIGMQSLLERVWQEEGFTALLVTHDVTEALTLADRVVLIENGRIALDLDIPFARPRRRGAVQFGALEDELLTTLLKSKSQIEEYII
jgi:sulfonate transport system ATP-binding protein